MSRSDIKRLLYVGKFMTSQKPDFLKKESLDGAQGDQKRLLGDLLGKNGGDTLNHIYRNDSFNKIVKSNVETSRRRGRERQRSQSIPSSNKRSWKAAFINSFEIGDKNFLSISVEMCNKELDG